jgi:hypothetical protein
MLALKCALCCKIISLKIGRKFKMGSEMLAENISKCLGPSARCGVLPPVQHMWLKAHSPQWQKGATQLPFKQAWVHVRVARLPSSMGL